MRFEFATAARIIFGPGTARELPAIASEFGRRAMVVTGRDKIRHAGVISDLEGAGFHCTLLGIQNEPNQEMVSAGVATLNGATVVIGLGGGSAIDAGKAIAGTARLPFVAVPTTAGTGSEVTPNAVLRDLQNEAKVSMRGPHMMPKVAIVDPDLTMSSPRHVTATSGLDALTQLIEPYTSNKANPISDAICREGLAVVARCLPRAWANASDREARAGMSYAALLSGMALTNAGLGVVHGLASPIGGKFDAPHGAVCAALLPNAIAANMRALRERAPESPALSRYAELGWVNGLVRELEIPSLRTYGICEAHLPGLVEKAMIASSMKFNSIRLTHEELIGVLATSL